MNWPDLDERRAKRIEGNGFTIYLFFPHGVRYRDAAHVLTLSSEPLLEEDERKKRRWLRGIYLPSSLRWDDGVSVTSVDEQLVLERMKAALQEKAEHYKFIQRDDVHS
jgi:hypothetical protein